MGRLIKRVPLDFDAPLDEVWFGYVTNCETCEQWDEEEEDCKIKFDYDQCPRHQEPPEGEGYQIWENVSEGSPISEVFETKEAVIEYLHEHGAGGVFTPCTRAAAKDFVDKEWAISFVGCSNMGLVDGINAYSGTIPSFLVGFDYFSDDVLDHVKELMDTELPDKELYNKVVKFRDRARKYTLAQAALAGIYHVCKDCMDKLPEEVQKAVNTFTVKLDELYPTDEE